MAGNLTRRDAQSRSELLTVESYRIELDLTGGTERFASTATVRFTCREPGRATFIDLAGANLLEAALNGNALDVTCYDVGAGRLTLPDLAAENELRIVAECAYSHSGQGLHRFVDPVDGRVYLHSQFATADAHQVFACFDQPDLKATYQLSVTAPADWTVVSNEAESARTVTGDTQHWTFPPTPRLSTYLVALVAGPYREFASSYDGPDGRTVPLRWFGRESLAEHLDADALFDLTRRGLDFYQDAFGQPMPFAKYDQLLVPEFNLGAMENPGAVTFNEKFIFRSRATDAEYEDRANVILHEMAHMWFGDLVTMRWWDDLWLNESFATFAAALCQSEATQWTDAWATFANHDKTRAYRQDQLPTTHPIAADIPDIRSMEVNFDAITYEKGAAVLKQLVATIGRDDFLAALRTYFADHAWSNATLADLLAALERQADRDLTGWSREWLQTAGPNTLVADSHTGPDGTYDAFTIVQSAPPEHPTLREHRFGIGLYDRAGAQLLRRQRIDVRISGARTEVAELIGVRPPDLLLPNADDQTYAKLRLDPASQRTALAHVGELADVLPQAVVWTTLWDLVRDAEISAAEFLAAVPGALPGVTNLGMLRQLVVHARTAAQQYSGPEHRAAATAGLAATLLDQARSAPAGDDRQRVLTLGFASVASTPAQLDLVAALLDGTRTWPGLVVDTDLRWALLRRLVATGRAGDEAIDAEARRDPTAAGARLAATCRAALPTPAAKAAAWARLCSGELTNALLSATAAGFAEPEQSALTAPFTADFFATLRVVVTAWPSELTQLLVRTSFAAFTDAATLVAGTDYLSSAQPPAWLGRLVLEGLDDMSRTLRAQARGHND